MSNKPNQRYESTQPGVYQIRVKGHLGVEWADWFEGFVITREDNGDSILIGQVVDQAALFGLIRKVRDLGIPLISINRVEDSVKKEGKA